MQLTCVRIVQKKKKLMRQRASEGLMNQKGCRLVFLYLLDRLCCYAALTPCVHKHCYTVLMQMQLQTQWNFLASKVSGQQSVAFFLG